MNLSDYAQALGAAQQLVPSYDQLRSNALAIQGQQLQNRAAQQEIAARDQAFEQQQRLASDIGALGSTATPEAYRNFALRYPQLAKPLLDAAGSMEAKQREQVVRDSAQIRATIAAGKPEIGAQLVQRHIDADIAAGKQPDPEDQALVAMLKSGDQAQLKAASGILYATLASFDPDSAAKNVGEYASPTDDKRYVVGRALVDQQGNALYRDPEPAREVPVYDTEGNRVGTQFVNAMGGGDPVSSGAAGGRGDTSRLINTDAGGGYVPASVQTLGQFVNFGRAMNRNGAKSSSAGIYQINGSTMADFAPRALGEGWQSAPFNAETQDRVGREIFNWAKGQPNPAAALRGRWVSLTPAESARLVQGGWEQARGLIARKESGGGPGASAGPAPGSSMVGPVPSTAAKPTRMTPAEVAAEGLDPNTVYYRNKDGLPTAVSGQAGKKSAQLTGEQSKATGLLGRMVAAQNALNTVSGYTPTVVASALGDLSNKNPIKANLSQTDRRVMNAQIAFANAILRLESGAAIGADETAKMAQTLFPMPGDGPEVQADKRRQREAAIAAMRAAAGPGSASVPKIIPNKYEGQPKRVRSLQEAMALPPGTIFIDPRGVRRRR